MASAFHSISSFGISLVFPISSRLSNYILCWQQQYFHFVRFNVLQSYLHLPMFMLAVSRFHLLMLRCVCVWVFVKAVLVKKKPLSFEPMSWTSVCVRVSWVVLMFFLRKERVFMYFIDIVNPVGTDLKHSHVMSTYPDQRDPFNHYTLAIADKWNYLFSDATLSLSTETVPFECYRRRVRSMITKPN